MLCQLAIGTQRDHVFQRVLYPNLDSSAVVAELERGKATAVDLPQVCALPGLKIQVQGALQRALTVVGLDAGEREVLASDPS